jgi:hypothetical protein
MDRWCSRRKLALLLVCTAVATASVDAQTPASAPQPASASTPHLAAVPVPTPPAIDGVLDDVAWAVAELQTGQWRSYNPLHGDTVPQETHVWIGYDTRYLYFAFQCDDPEPARIKTSVTRRDNIFSDDWVGLSLDARGSGQASYHMMVNPSGIQLDMLNSASGDEDMSPDWVWESAGRRNERGYAVEIRLPLESIQFSGGDAVRMGILFWRRVSRVGVSVAWPPLEPGKWVFDKHAALTFDHLAPRLAREVIPSATYAWSEARDAGPDWVGTANRADVGFSSRVGLTSTVTLDATVNPDFSQVESDAFQVEVNQRYPNFFSEKRPFFMQGSDVFKVAGVGNGDASMYAAVHTRNIVDPIVGAKVTGSADRVSFGWLMASDEAPGRLVPRGVQGHEANRLFNVGRVQYTLSPGSFAGAIATDTRFAGDENRVIGTDVSWRPRASDRVNAFVLQSWSDRRGDRSAGLGLQANYFSNSRRMTLGGQIEHYDRGFAMDTAFYNRVGFTSGWGYAEYSFYPDKARYPWLRRVSPFTFVSAGRDRVQDGDERLAVFGARLRFTRQGFFRADRIIGREPWAGREYETNRWRAMGEVQLQPWISVNAQWDAGGSIFYDRTAPFAGRSHNLSAGTTFQPTGRFSEQVNYTYVAFDRADTGAREYTIHIVNTRTTYQFTPHLFIRGIAQFDSSERRVLTDFLGSYELRPGTVLYAGYGALFEQRDFRDGQWIERQGHYLGTGRGLFFKASYLHRF